MSLQFGAFVPTIAKLEIVPLIYRLPKGRVRNGTRIDVNPTGELGETNDG
jgi:hypothetical protein